MVRLRFLSGSVVEISMVVFDWFWEVKTIMRRRRMVEKKPRVKQLWRLY